LYRQWRLARGSVPPFEPPDATAKTYATLTVGGGYVRAGVEKEVVVFKDKHSFPTPSQKYPTR